MTGTDERRQQRYVEPYITRDGGIALVDKFGNTLKVLNDTVPALNLVAYLDACDCVMRAGLTDLEKGAPPRDFTLSQVSGGFLTENRFNLVDNEERVYLAGLDDSNARPTLELAQRAYAVTRPDIYSVVATLDAKPVRLSPEADPAPDRDPTPSPSM